MNLDETFELEPYKPEDEFIINNSNIEDDIEYARKNIREIIDNSLQLLPHSIRMAKESESPRSVEVVSGLIKSLSDLNKDLISLKQKENKIEDAKTINNTQSNVFIGSTEEMFSKLKQLDLKELIKI